MSIFMVWKPLVAFWSAPMLLPVELPRCELIDGGPEPMFA
jgi:hypothetical protein